MKDALRRLVLALALVPPALCAGADAPRSIDPKSPFYERLMRSPMPASIEELLFAIDVARRASQHNAADRLRGWTERRLLRAVLEESPESTPATVGEAAATDPPAGTDELRMQARRKSVGLVAGAPRKSSTERTFRNFAGVPVTAFELVVSERKAPADLRCRYDGAPIAPRETVTVACDANSGQPRLENSPYGIASVRYEPGGYRNEGATGFFTEPHEAHRQRLAQVPPEEFARPRPDKPAELAGFAHRWKNLVAGGIFLLGLVIGWAVGARARRPVKTAASLSFLFAALIVAAIVAGVFFIGSQGPYVDTGGFLLLLLGMVLTGAAMLAFSAWLVFNAGLWIGAIAGSRGRPLPG